MREFCAFVSMLFAAVCGAALVVGWKLQDWHAAVVLVECAAVMVGGAGVVWGALWGACALGRRAILARRASR
jgi:hypothetical protein